MALQEGLPLASVSGATMVEDVTTAVRMASFTLRLCA